MDGRLILVRHGETEANRIGCFAASDHISLTLLGERQARDLALEIERQFQPVKVYSSEYHRARQTASAVALHLAMEVTLLPGIQERNFGILRGKPYRDMGLMMESDASYHSSPALVVDPRPAVKVWTR